MDKSNYILTLARRVVFGIGFCFFVQPVLAVDNLEISNQPLSVSTERVEPNVVIVMDNSGSMRTRVGGWNSDTRMEVAKQVATEVINDVDGVRFGMFNFNDSQGGSLSEAIIENTLCDTVCRNECTQWSWWTCVRYEEVCREECNTYNEVRYAECGVATKSELTSIIDDFEPETWTPLAETLYEVTRYYRGMHPMFGENNGYAGRNEPYISPIQYRCQKNFAIVITDGLPTYDYDIHSASGDISIDGKRLPNWDGINDDNVNRNRQDREGTNKFIDDVAMFARDIDFFTAADGVDIKGGSWDDPAHKQQNMFTYTIGFQLDNELLQQTAAKGSGQYLTANDAQQLKDALTSTLSDIASRVLSSSSAAASSGTAVNADTFFPSYNSSGWSGELKKENPDRTEAWKASEKLPSPASRNIYFNDEGTSEQFVWNNLNSNMRSLFSSYDRLGGNGSSVLEFLRGDRSNESATKYRIRNSALGDIVNSTPVFVGKPDFRYSRNLESVNYTDFKTNYENRREMVYVGANDGMLHGFDAQTGVERFAFIPAAVLRNLPKLSDPNYDHTYYADGSPTVVDAFVKANGTGSKQWRTVLVSGLNAGGQSIYAIDVTNPDSLNASSFMWEFTDPDLGYTYSKPAIVRLADGRWAAVFGNGYNSTQKANTEDNKVSTTGNAVLFIVDLNDGSLIKKIDTSVGAEQDPVAGKKRPNGLGTVAPIDYNRDSIVDYVYAGDLFGNVWKFDLTPSDPRNPSTIRMELSFNGNPLFTARHTEDGVTQYQPIMVAPDARPTVGRHPRGGFMVYFGTGKYIETFDRSIEGAGMQSFYAIWDKDLGGSVTPVTGRDKLLKQEILSQTTQSFGSESAEVRKVSNNAINWGSHLGWYIDFDQTTPYYERVVVTPTLRNDKVFFPTAIPLLKDDPCDNDSDSWLMSLDALSGARLSYNTFDLNDDGIFDFNDGFADRSTVSGWKFNSEIQQPTVLVDGDKEEWVLSDGTRIRANPGAGFEGRQSWREILEN